MPISNQHRPEDEIQLLSSTVSLTSSEEQLDNPVSPFDITEELESNGNASAIKRSLYISHSLSTWNSRVFEFGAVLMLAHIYDDTLLPASLYALARAASAVCLSPIVGRYVDQEDRLKVVRRSIVGQRMAVILSCSAFWILAAHRAIFPLAKSFLFGILAALACVEKLCSIMNLIAIERDWVVLISEEIACELEVLNSQMRRIDLICKLLGPLVIASIDARSVLWNIGVIFGMNILSLLVEYFAIADVYRLVPALRSKSTASADTLDLPAATQHMAAHERLFLLLFRRVQDVFKALSDYSHLVAFLPSLALCLLYLTVLSFSGQMVTYLVSVGVTSTQIGLLRTISTAIEVSATWLAPVAMSRIGPLRYGLWFINWQIACLLGAVASFWIVEKPIMAASMLVVGMIASRVGLWGFDLCVQIIVQEVHP